MKKRTLRSRWAAMLMCAGSLFAGSALAVPTLFYSDLDSAPADAYVTVWGKGFGSEAGAIEVGAGITAPEDIISWSDDKVEFRLPAHASTDIQLLTAGSERSNTLPFVTRSNGQIYFVAADGSDSNDGLAPTRSGGSGPWRNLPRLLDTVQPGDVVYVRSGDYTRIHDSTWKTHLLIREKYSGTAGNPIAITAYPGEKPVIGTTGSGSTARAVYMHYSLAYWTIAKMTLKATDTAIGFTQNGSPQGIRMIGNSAGGIASRYGTIRFNGCTDCKVLGNHVYDSGEPGNKLAHLIYYGGYGPGANVEIAWNRLHDQHGGRGIQVYGHTDSDSLSGLSIHDNVIYNIPYDGILVGSSDAARKDWIEDARIYNNTVYNVGHAGIRVHNPGVEALVAHNTVDGSDIGLRIQQARRIDVLNNLFSDNATAIRFDSANAHVIEHNGYTAESATQDAYPHYGNPSYTDAGQGDYSLQDDSSFLGDGVMVDPPLPTVSVPDMSNPHLGALGWMNQAAGGGGSSSEPSTDEPEDSESTGNEAPVASFTVDCDGLGCSFDAAASSDSDGSIASYAWDFGDGATGSGEIIAHDYIDEGSHAVTLTVTDDAGASATHTESVDVSAPLVADDISLVAIGYNIRGTKGARLSWMGASGDQVEIRRWRNGGEPTTRTTANDGVQTDSVSKGGTYTYQICASNGAGCSEVVVAISQ